MMRFTFKKGLVFIALQNRWELTRRLVSKKLQFECETGEIKTLADTEVYKLWMSGEWIIDVDSIGTQGDVLYLATPRDLSTYPESWQKKAVRKLHYINAVNPEVNKYSPKRWKPLIEAASKEINDEIMPAASSIHNWWKRYRITKSINSLMEHRTKKRSDFVRLEIFQEALSEIFMTSQKVPRIEVVHSMYRKIDHLNRRRNISEQIKRPHKSTIYKWMDELQQDLVDKSRLGVDATRAKYRISMGKLTVSGILERVEVDHTPLDLIVIDHITKLPLGRPWLTLAIDKFSRMVVGFYICFNSPSTHSVLQCLKRAILPKDKWLSRFPDIKGDWPAHGIPRLIATDNGMDLHSEGFEKTCMELGIQILYCPAATPEMKGSVERFFRTMNQGLIHRLPGTVFSNIEQRGDYPAEELATIDMETLLHLITKWIVDVYNLTFHRGLKATPLDKWLESAQKTIVDLPVHPMQLDVITGIPAKRTIFHYGIELEGLHYNSRSLQEIKKRSGENLQVQLKFYMDSVMFIHVFDPYTKEYLKVDCVSDVYSSDLPRDAHRLNKEHARRKFGDQYNVNHLIEAREEIQQTIQAAINNKKMQNRKLGAHLMMHDSEAILESKDPLKEAKRPIKTSPRKTPDMLPEGLDDELPNLILPPLPSFDLDEPESDGSK